jgi:potassium efflux system protein
LHSWRIQFLDFNKTFWEARFTAINAKDPEEIRKAIDAIKQLSERVETWAKISQLRIAGGDPETGELDPAKLRDAVFQLRSMQRRVGFALADLSRWSLSNRGTPLFDKLVTSLHAIWNTELYVVEESDIVNGEKILFHLPVTVAKLARLALILIVGWWLLRLVSRRVRAVVMRRGKIPEATASLAEKWAFGIGLFLLVLYGLHTVRIPLTAFAFIGGALAIGVGFGTQTILKNFISGIIILFERPLKVGDVVEVANITGTIKQIGMRASVIHHFDGIETLVPNSILLENQLTNWTFSSTVIRHSIIVGVAYGSPTREVARLLLGVATGHGLVKKDPAPEVRFDDFGADSLTFTLLFWLDTRKTGRAQLASDLRYMIDKAFAEAGIVIAYPQRDIHFDPDKPLRVEMTRSAIAGPKKVDPPDPAQGVSP